MMVPHALFLPVRSSLLARPLDMSTDAQYDPVLRLSYPCPLRCRTSKRSRAVVFDEDEDLHIVSYVAYVSLLANNSHLLGPTSVVKKQRLPGLGRRLSLCSLGRRTSLLPRRLRPVQAHPHLLSRRTLRSFFRMSCSDWTLQGSVDGFVHLSADDHRPWRDRSSTNVTVRFLAGAVTTS